MCVCLKITAKISGVQQTTGHRNTQCCRMQPLLTYRVVAQFHVVILIVRGCGRSSRCANVLESGESCFELCMNKNWARSSDPNKTKGCYDWLVKLHWRRRLGPFLHMLNSLCKIHSGLTHFMQTAVDSYPLNSTVQYMLRLDNNATKKSRTKNGPKNPQKI